MNSFPSIKGSLSAADPDFYRMLVESLRDHVVFGLDLSGHITASTPSVKPLLGYEMDEVLGQHISVFHKPEEVGAGHPEEELRVALEQGQYEEQGWRIKKGGSQFWASVVINPIIDEQGSAVGFAKITRDVSDLQFDETRYCRLFETACEAFVVVNEPGDIMFVNRRAEAMFGYSRKELLSMRVEMLMPQRFRANHPTFRAAMLMGDCFALYDKETRRMQVPGLRMFGLRKNGEEFPVEISLSALDSREGNLVTCSITDITRRVVQEDSLVRSNEDLLQFARIASHDLQEPLRTITSFVQLIDKRYQSALDDDGRQWMSYIVEATARMQRLINDLLAYSRAGSSIKEPAPTDMAKVFGAVLSDLRIAIEQSGAEVSASALPCVMADEVQISQLLQNLIGNAIKYRGERAPVVQVEAKWTEGLWTFSVKDNGIGIESQYFERVFMIFQRLHTRAKYEGTGMGLALCKRIVERHGGRIWVESEQGKGSVFYFTLMGSPELLAENQERGLTQ